MLSKNDIKFIRSLGQAKQRKSQACFVAEGSKIINELLTSGLVHKKIFTVDSSKIEVEENVFEINPKQLDQISFLSSPQDSLAIFNIPNKKISEISVEHDYSIVLDRVQDPGNFGTIIRIADWFGIKKIFCSKECADVYNPKVVQSTMGSLGRIEIFYLDLIPWLTDLKGKVPIIVTSLNGQNMYEKKLPKSGLLVFGNESKGISNEVLELSDFKIQIPGLGMAESLNVAISAGIICAEIRRIN